MFQSWIYYLASPVWQFIICVRMLHLYSTPLCTWLHAYSKTKLDLWNELDSLVHSIKRESGQRNIRLLRSHRQKYSYTNTPLRKPGKAHLLLSVEKCNLITKITTTKKTREKTIVKFTVVCWAPWACSSSNASPDLEVHLYVHKFMSHKLFQALQVRSIQLYIIVSRTLHPQRLHGPLAALVQGQSMGKINHLVLRTMDHQHRRSDFRDFINAEGKKKKIQKHMNRVFFHTMLFKTNLCDL